MHRFWRGIPEPPSLNLGESLLPLMSAAFTKVEIRNPGNKGPEPVSSHATNTQNRRTRAAGIKINRAQNQHIHQIPAAKRGYPTLLQVPSQGRSGDREQAQGVEQIVRRPLSIQIVNSPTSTRTRGHGW